jgi:hypothetical protein
MASKLSRQLLTVCSSVAFIGGCSQILGISDYEIEPDVGHHSDHIGGAGGEGNPDPGDGGANTAGTQNHAGTGHGGQPEAGAGPEPGVAGSPVTDAGAGGTNSQPGTEIVPCDSAECCADLGGTAVGVELLKDGGFELGTVDDGSPWKEVTTTTSNELIFNDLSLGFAPKTGDYFVYLSGIAGEDSTVYQTPVVPKDAGWLVVSGWRYFQVDTQDDTNADFAGIGFYDYPSGDQLELPFYWSTPPSQNGWGDSRKWTHFEYSFDALPHQGKKREIDFRGSSDKYSTDPDLDSSSYLFDDLSLKAFTCRK